MAKEISASDDIVPSHAPTVIAAGAPSPVHSADSDCNISSNVNDAFAEALDEHAEDPAEIIHDVQCVSESHLMANLDSGGVPSPDLHLLASFAEDGLSSAEEGMYDAPHELPSSFYENLFQTDDQGGETGKPLEETGVVTSSVPMLYPAMIPPPSYPASTSTSHGFSILERQLTSSAAMSETTPAKMWLPPRAKSTTWGGNLRPSATATYAPAGGFQSAPFHQYPSLGAHQNQAVADAEGGQVLEEARHFVPSCTYLPSGLSMPGLQTNDTYLVPILPKPHYQELLLRQPAANVQLIPKPLVLASSPGYPFGGSNHLSCLPVYPVLNPRMALVGAEMPSSSSNGDARCASYARPIAYSCMRDQLQPPESASGYPAMNPEYPPWMPWQRSQRTGRYEEEGAFAAQADTTYGGFPDAYQRPSATPAVNYPLPPLETVLPDAPPRPKEDYLNRSPPRYVPPRARDPAGNRYEEGNGEYHAGLDMGYRQSAEAEGLSQVAAPPAQYEAVPPAQQAQAATGGAASKEYLVPLNFKEGGQGALCSICFPNSALPSVRPPSGTQGPPAGPGNQQPLAPRDAVALQARKQRQYITVRQMLLERAQKRYLEHGADVRKPASAAQDTAPVTLAYVKPPAPMSTNTVTMSYPSLPLEPSTTATSYSQTIPGIGIASCQRPTLVPLTSTICTSLPPPLYSFSNMASKAQMPGFFSSQQPGQSIQPKTSASLRLPEKPPSEVASILRAQLLAPLIMPKNAPQEIVRNVLMTRNWLPGGPTVPRVNAEIRLPTQTTTLPALPLQKPQLKVSASYIAVPSSYRLQLPQLFSPTSKAHESGGNSDGARPPKHYDLETLKIGTFKVEKLNNLRNVNKFKIFFAKRKFAYEFSLENVPLAPNHDAAIPHMAIIDVPFNIVTAIHCNDQEVIIAVCSPPKLFLGCKQSRNGGSMCAGIYFDRDRPTDITNGQLRTSQVHKVCLKRRQAESLRYQLESFDPRFSIILNSPIFEAIAEIEEPTTPICLSPTEAATESGKHQGENPYQGPPAKKHCILEVITPDVTPKVSVTPIVCHCQVSCCSNRCSCMKSKSKCGHTPVGCMCKDCDNPLNMLEEMGLDLEESISDSCLVQGIVSYKGDLNALMKKKLTFQCCGMQTRVEDCIPGKVKCSNEACSGRAYRFSWCFLELRDEVVNPRNHCSACKSCKDPIDLHCQACRKCNPVEGNCTKCPFCGAARNTSFTEQGSVSEVLNRYRQNQQRGFGLASVMGKTVEKVIAIPTDKNDLLNLPKIVERLNEKMKEQCVEVSNTDEEENEADKMEEEIPKENNLVIAEEVNIVDSTIVLSDVEVVTTQELPENGSPVNV